MEYAELDLDYAGVIPRNENDVPEEVDLFHSPTREEKEIAKAARREAWALTRQGNYQQALQHLKCVIKLNPSLDSYFVARGLVFIKEQMPCCAIHDANVVISRNEEMSVEKAKAFKIRGISEAMLGQWIESRNDLHTAIRKLAYDFDIYHIINRIEANVYKIERHLKVPVPKFWEHAEVHKTWRDYAVRVLNFVRHQLLCDCCWAIAICECVEALRRIQGQDRELIQLSVQDLINCCDQSKPLDECYAYKYEPALEHMMTIGARLERENPFRHKRQECTLCNVPRENLIRIKGFHQFNPEIDEEEMKDYVLCTGPIIAATYMGTEFAALGPQDIYLGKLRSAPKKEHPKHAILITGYGRCERTGLNYWEFQNSHGLNRNYDGYGRVVRQSSTPPERVALRFVYAVQI